MSSTKPTVCPICGGNLLMNPANMRYICQSRQHLCRVCEMPLEYNPIRKDWECPNLACHTNTGRAEQTVPVAKCKQCDQPLRLNMASREWECLHCTGAIKAEAEPESPDPDHQAAQTDEYLEPMRSELAELLVEAGLKAANNMDDITETLISLMWAVSVKYQYQSVRLADKPGLIPLAEYANYKGIRNGDRINISGKTFHVVEEKTYIPGMREVEVN